MMARGVFLLQRKGVKSVYALLLANMLAGGRGRRRDFNRLMGVGDMG
jgi:hypothetical protein